MKLSGDAETYTATVTFDTKDLFVALVLVAHAALRILSNAGSLHSAGYSIWN